MKRTVWAAFNLLFLASGLKSPLQAQSPIGGAFPLYVNPDRSVASQLDAAFQPDGGFLVCFQTLDAKGDDDLRVMR